MIGNRMCTLALSAASVIIWSTPPAIAAGYDGSWAWSRRRPAAIAEPSLLASR